MNNPAQLRECVCLCAIIEYGEQASLYSRREWPRSAVSVQDNLGRANRKTKGVFVEGRPLLLMEQSSGKRTVHSEPISGDPH
jgi:hypothetical protein